MAHRSRLKAPPPKGQRVEPSPEKPKSAVGVMKYKCTFSGTISDVFKRRGWIPVDDGCQDWDIYFSDMVQMRDLFTIGSRPLGEHQRVGHFRNSYEISRKNFMVRNLKRLKSRIEKAFGKEEGKKCAFFPTTFILPLEERWFLQEFRYKPSCFWIIKPAAGAQGRGIFIFRNIKDFYDWRGKQDAVTNPPGPGQDPSLTAQQQQYVMARLQISPSDLKKTTPTDTTSSPDGVISIPSDKGGAENEFDGQQSPDNNLSATIGIPQEPEVLTPSKDEPSRTTEGNKNDIYVIQQYIANPYLIGGRKFDIRFFVLVTSFMPLRAWIYRDGFARFSQGQYSLESLQDVYIHLTNVAIQRTAEDYNPEMGSKWSIAKLRQYLTARHGTASVQRLMNQIDNIVIRTLQSVQQLIIPDRHCFEVYGFDVLIDDVLEPWLLEVNCSPSLTPSNEEDYRLKSSLIDDTVHVLDLEGRLTGFEKRVGGFDMIWDDGPVYGVPADCGNANGCDEGLKLNSFLGCYNDRIAQLRMIFTNAQFIRMVQKVNTGSVPVTNSGPSPTNRGSSVRTPTEIQDERFRIPSTTPKRDLPIFKQRRLGSHAGLASGQNSAGPLIVLGKAVESKRNSNKR